MTATQPPRNVSAVGGAVFKLAYALDLIDEAVVKLAAAGHHDLAEMVLGDYNTVEATRRILRRTAHEMRSA